MWLIRITGMGEKKGPLRFLAWSRTHPISRPFCPVHPHHRTTFSPWSLQN